MSLSEHSERQLQYAESADAFFSIIKSFNQVTFKDYLILMSLANKNIHVEFNGDFINKFIVIIFEVGITSSDARSIIRGLQLVEGKLFQSTFFAIINSIGNCVSKEVVLEVVDLFMGIFPDDMDFIKRAVKSLPDCVSNHERQKILSSHIKVRQQKIVQEERAIFINKPINVFYSWVGRIWFGLLGFVMSGIIFTIIGLTNAYYVLFIILWVVGWIVLRQNIVEVLSSIWFLVVKFGIVEPISEQDWYKPCVTISVLSIPYLVLNIFLLPYPSFLDSIITGLLLFFQWKVYLILIVTLSLSWIAVNLSRKKPIYVNFLKSVIRAPIVEEITFRFIPFTLLGATANGVFFIFPYYKIPILEKVLSEWVSYSTVEAINSSAFFHTSLISFHNLSISISGLVVLIVTSLLFFAAHGMGRGLHHATVGIINGYTFYKFNNIFIVIVIHMLWNFGSYLFSVIFFRSGNEI